MKRQDSFIGVYDEDLRTCCFENTFCRGGRVEQKKVFLYNTHLDNIINHPNEVVNRIKWVISFFKARQDCILLWRPHPLSIDTIKSMCPGLLIEYMELVKTFKCMANGIYDDSADMQRAIVVSDAYIGDMSSLVALYKETGKPLYLMDINVKEPLACSQFGNFAHFCCADVVGSKMYAAADNFNAFYIIDMNKNEVEYAAMFEGESKTASSLFQRVIAYKDRVYFIPYYAHALHWYDCTDGKIKKRYIVDGNKRLSEFVEAFAVEDNLYMFMNKKDTIVIVNLKDDTIKILHHCMNGLDINAAFNGNVFVSGFASGDYVVIASMYGLCFTVFDIKRQSCHRHLLDGVIDDYLLDVTTDGINLYFLTVSGDIVKWDYTTGKGSTICKMHDKSGGCPFFRIFYGSDKVWLLPGLSDNMVYVETDTGTSHKIGKYPVEDSIGTNTETIKSVSYYWSGKSIKLFPRLVNEMITIDSETTNVKEDRIALPYSFKGKYIIEKLSENRIYNERICPIDYFIDNILNEKDVSKEGDRIEKKSYGDVIFKHIKSLI